MTPAPQTRRLLVKSLLWLEWSLFAIGAALAVWAIVVMGRAYYYSRMPVPPPSAARTLPGESPSPGSATPPAVVPPPARGSWLARLEAPSISLSATVLEGSDDATLSRGAGHIEDTAMPGAASGNVGIAGHRDTTFRPLRRVRVGDEMTLTTADQSARYRVSETRIVGPEAVEVLDPTERPSLTLVTCYPFTFVGHAPKRFIVRAELVESEARQSDATR